MRTTKIVLCILLVVFLSACSGDNDGSSGGGSSLTCSDIAGDYHGSVRDNCSGNYSTADILVSVTSDCSFNGQSSQGVGFSGTFTARNGEALQGNGVTNSSGCGSFTINCNTGSGNTNCKYTYSNGRDGSFTGQL